MQSRRSLPYINDQRGVAMLLELVLVAAVLALVGVAVYQTSHHSQTASNTSVAPAKQSAANSAANAAEAAANNETNLSNSAEAAADNEVNAANQDATNLGGSSNASF